MLKCLNNDSKIQMRLNIKRHRQKLLQYLENINDTVLKPKIKLVSNDLEKNNFNKLVSNDVEKSNLKKLVSNNIEKSNLKKLVSSDTDKSNLNKLDSNDVEKSNLNKLVSNDIEKSYLNHNVKPKITTSADWQNPKHRSTIKFTNYKNKSRIRIKTYERVINTRPKNHEILTDIDVKKHNTRSSLSMNQLQPNFKINIQEKPLSNFEFIPEPLPLPELKIEIKDPDPEPNIEIIDSPEPPITVKKLKEQLLEELFEDSSSSEEIEDNISVGSNEDWNEIYQTHNENDADENDSSNSSLIESVKYDSHKQLPNEKSEDYLYFSGNSDNSALDINYPTTSKVNQTRKRILSRSQFQNDKPKHRFRKPQDRDLHNAKERACRERIAKKFAILRKSCSYLNSNRRVPSKHSILLAAKKECDLLKHFEKKMLAEKKVWRKANEDLRKRIADYISKDSKLAYLI